MLTFHLDKEDHQMVSFQSSEENQSKDNSELLPKQCQNNFAVVSGATIMLIISAMIYKNLEGEGEQSHHNTECISY